MGEVASRELRNNTRGVLLGPVSGRPRWMSSAEFARRFTARRADAALTDDVRELMHDGCPVACVGDTPYGYVNVVNSHVNVGFFLGAELDDPTGLLQGAGRSMRHVQVRPGVDVDDAALSLLITAAYADLKSRLVAD